MSVPVGFRQFIYSVQERFTKNRGPFTELNHMDLRVINNKGLPMRQLKNVSAILTTPG